MPLSFGLIYDLVFVIILVITALHGRRQGLLSGLVGLAGAVLGVLGAPGFGLLLMLQWVLR